MAQMLTYIWEKDGWFGISLLQTASTIDAAHELLLLLFLPPPSPLSPHPGLQSQSPSLWHPPSLLPALSLLCVRFLLSLPWCPLLQQRKLLFHFPLWEQLIHAPLPPSENSEESHITCINDVALVTSKKYRRFDVTKSMKAYFYI